MTKEGEGENQMRQFMKFPNTQNDENAQVKNEDALYKYLTFSAMQEKSRRANIKDTRDNSEYAYGLHSFEEFYKG